MVFAKGIVSDEAEFQLAWDKMNRDLLKTSTIITRSQQGKKKFPALFSKSKNRLF